MESKNLNIRKTEFNDCTFFEKWEKQDYIKQYLTIEDARCYEAIVREYVTREMDNSKEQYTILLKQDGKPIGRIYLDKIDKKADSMDVTRIYIGDEQNIGKGYGREAMILILDYCFNTLKMQRVTLDHYGNNLKASKLYLSLGFKYEGIMRDAAKKNDEYYNLHLMSILKEDYLKNNLQLI